MIKILILLISHHSISNLGTSTTSPTYSSTKRATTGELVGTAELPSAVEHFLLRAPAKAYLALAVARQVADHLEGEAGPGGCPRSEWR